MNTASQFPASSRSKALDPAAKKAALLKAKANARPLQPVVTTWSLRPGQFGPKGVAVVDRCFLIRDVSGPEPGFSKGTLIFIVAHRINGYVDAAKFAALDKPELGKPFVDIAAELPAYVRDAVTAYLTLPVSLRRDSLKINDDGSFG